MEFHLPGEKVNQLQVLLEKWSVKKSCCKKELLFFIGKLALACKIVRIGWIFLSWFIDYSMKAKCLYHWIHPSGGLGTWCTYQSCSSTCSLSLVASGSYGCVAVWQHQWLQWQWQPTWAMHSILQSRSYCQHANTDNIVRYWKSVITLLSI